MGCDIMIFVFMRAQEISLQHLLLIQAAINNFVRQAIFYDQMELKWCMHHSGVIQNQHIVGKYECIKLVFSQGLYMYIFL